MEGPVRYFSRKNKKRRYEKLYLSVSLSLFRQFQVCLLVRVFAEEPDEAAEVLGRGGERLEGLLRQAPARPEALFPVLRTGRHGVGHAHGDEDPQQRGERRNLVTINLITYFANAIFREMTHCRILFA